MKGKIIFLIALILFSGAASANTGTVIDDPDTSYEHDVEEDFTVTWTSANNLDGYDREIIESEIRIEGDEDRRVDFIESRGDLVSSNDDIKETFTISSSELDSLEPGGWSVDVIDTWEEIDEGEEVISEEKSEDQLSFEAIEKEAEAEGEVLITINSPENEETFSPGDDISIEWEATNDYNLDQVLETSRVELGSLYDNTADTSQNVPEGQTTALDFTIDTSEFFDDIEEGTETLKITDNWEEGVVTESIDIEFSEDGGDEVSISGEASLGIDSPEEGSNEDIDSNLFVEWTSESNFDDVVELQETEVKLEDSVGRTTETILNINKDIGAGGTTQNSVTFDAGDYSSFDEGEWAVRVKDIWAEDTSTASITFTMEEAVGEDDSDGDGIDEETTDDGSEEDTADATDETTEDGMEGSDKDETVDDSNGEETTESGVDECPDGFVYDAENEVCLEDTEEYDGQEGVGEAVESVDESEEGVLQSFAVGPDIWSVPLWMPLAALLVLGVLFRRSSYEIEY